MQFQVRRTQGKSTHRRRWPRRCWPRRGCFRGGGGPPTRNCLRVRRFPTPKALGLSTATQDDGPRHFDGVDLARDRGLTCANVALPHDHNSSSRDAARRREKMGHERLAPTPLYPGQWRLAHARMRCVQQPRPIHPASPQVRKPWREERRSGDTAPRVPPGGVIGSRAQAPRLLTTQGHESVSNARGAHTAY
jgi:hypothetical protein